MKIKKVAIVLIIIGALVVQLGYSMRIMHWPMAKVVYYSGGVFLVVALVIQFYNKK